MKRWKKGLAWLLSVMCILVTVQIPSISASATETYNASAAVEYALNNWNKSSELCAGFISNCLWAGGLSSFPYRATADICDYGNITNYGFEKSILSYTGTGSIKNNGSNARSGINEIGVRVGTGANNWNVGKIENQALSSAGYTQLNNNGYFEMWFDCNAELNTHPVLSPGKTYYYHFFVKINGKERVLPGSSLFVYTDSRDL